jgi:dolichyl-phosphate-mannose--protein O-mannosyl transferase
MTSPPAVEVRQRKLTSSEFEYDPAFLTNTPDPNTTATSKPQSLVQSKSETAIKTEQPAPKPDRLITLAFAVLGILTRYFRISAGKYVLWDEAHFGKFGSHYLKRTFYFDVHPPLGKMLVGLAGWLSGYDGLYEFASGSDYPSTVNYVGMRMFLALFSALAVPFAYLTAVQLKLNKPASILVGLMTLLGNPTIP